MAIGMNSFWTAVLRFKLWRRGVASNNCIAHGPVKLDLHSDAKLFFGSGVFFRGNCEIKIRENGSITFGDAVRLYFGVRITVAQDYIVSLGPKAELGFCSLVNCGADIDIGAGTAIGGHCVLQSSEHLVEKDQKHSVMDGGYYRESIIIGKNVWLASFVLVRPGTVIADTAVVGAFSMVKGNVPEGSTVAGIPAKQLDSHIRRR